MKNIENVKRICFIWIGRVGDFIVSTPFIRGMREKFPESEISVVVNKPVRELAFAIQYIDNIITYPKLSNLMDLPLFVYKFFLKNWDIVIDLNPSSSKTSAYLSLMTRARIRVSFDKSSAKVFTHTVKSDSFEHMVIKYKALAELFDAPFEPLLEFNPPNKYRTKAERLYRTLSLDYDKKSIAIHPGNFIKFDHRWPEEKFIELTNRIMKTGQFNVVYIAGLKEEEKVEKMIRQCVQSPLMVSSMPLPEIAAFFSLFDLLIFNPTGTMHLAASVGAPMITMHTEYSYKCWRSLNENSISIRSDNWESLRSISVDEVWDAFLEHFDLKSNDTLTR